MYGPLTAVAEEPKPVFTKIRFFRRLEANLFGKLFRNEIFQKVVTFLGFIGILLFVVENLIEWRSIQAQAAKMGSHSFVFTRFFTEFLVEIPVEPRFQTGKDMRFSPAFEAF